MAQRNESGPRDVDRMKAKSIDRWIEIGISVGGGMALVSACALFSAWLIGALGVELPLLQISFGMLCLLTLCVGVLIFAPCLWVELKTNDEPPL